MRLVGSLVVHICHSQPFFTDRVFQIFDKDNSGSISLQEFIDAIHQFSGQSADDKIRFLFKVYDIDGKHIARVITLFGGYSKAALVWHSVKTMHFSTKWAVVIDRSKRVFTTQLVMR